MALEMPPAEVLERLSKQGKAYGIGMAFGDPKRLEIRQTFESGSHRFD